MDSNRERAIAVLRRWKLKAPIICATALVSFLAGSLCTARLMHPPTAHADSNRVFQLMVYHTLPGKAPALESIFRDVSVLQAKHNLNAVGYWVPSDDSAWKDTFVYLIAHPSVEEAAKNWNALHTDPAFPPYFKAAAPLIEQKNGLYNVEQIYMRPTEFSAMK